MAYLQGVDLKLTTKLLKIPYSPYGAELQESTAVKNESGAPAVKIESSETLEHPKPTSDLTPTYFYLRCPTFKMLAVAADSGVILASIHSMDEVNEAYFSGV